LAVAGRPRFGLGTTFIAFIAIFGFRARMNVNESAIRQSLRRIPLGIDAATLQMVLRAVRIITVMHLSLRLFCWLLLNLS
jgi:hypothetical protein